jgi:GTP-binding protein HflX
MEPKERAILVGVVIPKQADFEYAMVELGNLAAACDVAVVGQITQKMNRVNKASYLGKGKIAAVVALLAEVEAEMAIFNDELSPTQIRNLEALLECAVIDRTMLILDIFAKRAKTKEAQLQVEVAQLRYLLPRLTGRGVTLGRQGGGVGTQNRGAGEKKLELDRRKIGTRITALNRGLETVVAQRQTQRKLRKKQALPVVSLVGYTNAGKSTVMNALVELYGAADNKLVFEKDLLFATLETAVRKIQLPDHRAFLLTDTVGFVNGLPHQLIKAFRSTLEEVAEADLIIHVVDIANPHYQQFIEVTKATLKEIGVVDVPTIYAYNKVDLTDLIDPISCINCAFISAKHRTGIAELVQQIGKHLFADYVQCEMLIPYEQGQTVSYFNERAKIIATNYEADGTRIKLECPVADLENYQRFVTNIGGKIGGKD